MHIGNHAIKLLYGQCNMKCWFLADGIVVICCYYNPNNFMWWILWLGQSIKINSSKSTST